MANLPCILCGEEVYAFLGNNTIVHDGVTYARHNGASCQGGGWDSSQYHVFIDNLPEEKRRLSIVPPEDYSR